jgi:hypothetical protein
MRPAWGGIWPSAYWVARYHAGSRHSRSDSHTTESSSKMEVHYILPLSYVVTEPLPQTPACCQAEKSQAITKPFRPNSVAKLPLKHALVNSENCTKRILIVLRTLTIHYTTIVCSMSNEQSLEGVPCRFPPWHLTYEGVRMFPGVYWPAQDPVDSIGSGVARLEHILLWLAGVQSAGVSR